MRNTLKALGCDYIYQDTPIDVTSSLQIQREKHIAAIIKTEHPAYACKTLEELKNAMLSFNECALKKTALNTVFCDGNPQADVMLIGEAPGADEDAQGLPFVGQSGQLLNKIFQAIGLDRTKLYIANILPWRPPGNRTPTNEEIAMCQPFVEQHIQLIRPKLLIFLGGVSATMFAWTGSAWGSISSTAAIYRYKFTAAGGETSESGLDDNGLTLSYIAGKEQVYLNGVLLVRGTDYTASNGTSITSLAALSAGDILEIITFTAFDLATAIDKALFDAKGDILVATAADTPGKLTVGTNGYYLKADSSTATGLVWSAVDALPSQTGNSGKYLTTNGTAASWATVDTQSVEVMSLMGAY